MKMGAELPGAARPSSLRLLGTVGEPINPEAWVWYREGTSAAERCPIVDTLVADRDRRHPHHAAARR